MTMPDAPPTAVANSFEQMPEECVQTLMSVRRMIGEQASMAGVEPLTETLKWGQPSYLTDRAKTGTTIRLGVLAGRPALFVHCQTTLIEEAREKFGDTLEFSGNRAVILPDDAQTNDALRHIIATALTYHSRKR